MSAAPADPGAPRAGALELDALTKRYGGSGPPAVDGLTLTVPAGQVCVLIGPSGCGKTTALKMINRLIEPTSGDVRVDGVSVRSRPPAELRRDIGYVIQQVGLLPHLTVAANIATVPRLLGWPRDRQRARSRELLELIGLDPDEYAQRYPAELSGGQQQRVGLARALAADPPLMLMDEPFSAVDPVTRDRLQNDFLRLHRHVPKTVVFVSHDIDEAVKMADLIAIMDRGRLVQCAPPAELLASPATPFVADFVGADRALKGLSLVRLEDIPLLPAPTVGPDDTPASARARVAAGNLSPVDGAVLVVDRTGRPLRWRRIDDAEWAPDHGASHLEPVIDRMATLRDALSALFEASVTHGVVVDGEGRCLGLVDVRTVAGGLRGPAAVVSGE